MKLWANFVINEQGRRVSRVNPTNTFEINKNIFSVLLSWLSGTPYTGTQQNRFDKMHRWPVPASQALLSS
jgi:hypothetical protein